MEGDSIKSVHRILSGLLISSAESRRLVDTLDLMLKPRIIDKNTVNKLNSKQKQFLLVSYQLPNANKFEWVLANHTRFIDRDPKAYALSGLAALPLPVWPFFGDNPSLDARVHFAHYLNAYHPELLCKISPGIFSVLLGSSFGVFCYQSDLSMCLSAAGDDYSVEITLFSREIGTIVFKRSSIIPESPLRAASISRLLSPLQYHGSLRCKEIGESIQGVYLSCIAYIQDNCLDEKADLIYETCKTTFSTAAGRDEMLAGVLKYFNMMIASGF